MPTQELDVSDLEPCEPLQRIRCAALALKSGESLRVIHRREPMLLYPVLEKAGLRWRTLERREGRFEMLVWRADAPPAELESEI